VPTPHRGVGTIGARENADSIDSLAHKFIEKRVGHSVFCRTKGPEVRILAVPFGERVSGCGAITRPSANGDREGLVTLPG
jgi:hypothetical protein